MDRLRYVFGVIMWVSVPISLGLWVAIHPFARAWRRIGPVGTYAVLAVPFAALGAWLWSTRGPLLGADLGTQPVLIVVGVLAFAGGIAIARRRRRQLTQRILTGIPELSQEKGTLLTDGIYARTRNPRYLEFLLIVLGYVAVANYTGTWVLWALCFPAIHGVVLLEERELRQRFGAEYDDYCRRVPRYLPRRRQRV
jgi:protein-S-isoprenylcysteine O-methyltransferase Ste14